MLSGPRDAQVKLETIDALRGRSEQMPTKTNLRAYIQALERERRSLSRAGPRRDEAVERAAREIEAGRAAVSDWAPSEDGWEIVAAASSTCLCASVLCGLPTTG